MNLHWDAPNSSKLCLFEAGREIHTAFGTYYIIEKELSLQDCMISAEHVSGADNKNTGGPSDFIEEKSLLKCNDKTVFLDIESTGLYPRQPLFLVGLFFYHNGKYKLQQYLARHPGEEKALLSDIAAAVGEFNTLVTYNGKKFDIPYIETRMKRHDLQCSFPHFHIDLLWFARRNYRDRLPNCRLATLEEHVLNLRRIDDIPGSRIPEAYNQFVKTQDPDKMLNILEHNALDLISLRRLMFLAR